MSRIPIDPQQWSELNRLLDQALDIAREDRDTWLESLPPEAQSLKPHLRDLLSRAARVETRDFLSTLPKLDDLSSPGHTRSSTDQAGECIGPYRLIRELGTGGMGSVWLAERNDGILKRQVALKLPHIASRRIGLAERMTREREILATLAHPNIARLYDAGIAEHERPYLALEYVEGEPINSYCETRNLGVEARLRLFLQVANAVAYAHAKLVIHRDLKPANILVTNDGEARLLDFGVAKLLDEGEARSTQLTELSGRALTPDYASPEQILGEPLTIATDVYSLGVVLHELLTGARPYQLKRDSRGALEEAIVQMEPSKPSDAAQPGLRKALRGDLDTIVLKALRKRPEDRYATVNAFAEDILRHLDHQPVLARPESFWYRTSRFVARRKLAVSLSALSLAAVLIGAGVAIWQMLEANAQRDAALAQQTRAESFSEFMSLLLQDAGARPLTAPDLLRRGTEILERQTDMDEQLLAHMYYEISRNYVFFNNTDSEIALLQRSAELAARHGDANLRAAAECSQAWSLSNRDRPAAEAKLAEGLRTLASVHAPQLHTLSDCHRAQGRLLHMQGDPEGAIAALKTGLAAFEGQSVRARTRRSLLMTELTNVYRFLDRYKDALPFSEQELRFIRDSGRGGSIIEIVAMNNHAGNLTRVGELVEAGELLNEALERIETSMQLAISPVGFRTNVATQMWRLGDFQRALELADVDRDLSEKAGNKASIALANLAAARALLGLGRLPESEVRLAQAEALWNTDRVQFERMLREAAVHRVEMHIASGDVSRAASLAEETLTAAGYPGTTAPGVDRILRSASKAHRLAGNADRAVTLATAALDYSRSLARDERLSADVGQAALLRAQALQDQGELTRARDDAALAAEALANGLGAQHGDSVAAAGLLKVLQTD